MLALNLMLYNILNTQARIIINYFKFIIITMLLIYLLLV